MIWEKSRDQYLQNHTVKVKLFLIKRGLLIFRKGPAIESWNKWRVKDLRLNVPLCALWITKSDYHGRWSIWKQIFKMFSGLMRLERLSMALTVGPEDGWWKAVAIVLDTNANRVEERWYPPWEAPPRGGGGHLLAAGVRRASHIPVLFGGRGQSAALGHSPSGLAYLHTHTHPTQRPRWEATWGALGPPTQPVEAGRGVKQQQQQERCWFGRGSLIVLKWGLTGAWRG